MAIITLPSLVAASIGGQGYAQLRADEDDRNEFTGAVFARALAPPRWRCTLRSKTGLRADTAEAAEWEMLLARLRGRVNHLALWDALRERPAGTARGTANTTTSTTAAVATTVAITGPHATPNLLQRASSSFEVDSNLDGLADGWIAYFGGSHGTPTYSLLPVPGPDGGSYAQRVQSSSLGTAVGDQMGVQTNAGSRPAVMPGLVYTLSAYIKSDNVGLGGRLYIGWWSGADGTGTNLANSDVIFTLGGGFQRYSLSAVAPSGAQSARAYVWAHSRPISAGAASVDIDAVQFERADVATPYAGLPTLLPGDWLQIGTGVGSHLAKVVEPVTLNDIGAGTVTFEPATRISYASGSAVAIERALGHYKLAAQPAAWSSLAGARAARPALDALALDLVERW